MEAYLHGVSTRKVDDLVKALGIDAGISKSEVSRICADLDVEVGAFRDRTLGETAYPYVFLDATYRKARVNHRVVSQAVVIATPRTAHVVGIWLGRRSCARSRLAAWAGWRRASKCCRWSDGDAFVGDALRRLLYFVPCGFLLS